MQHFLYSYHLLKMSLPSHCTASELINEQASMSSRIRKEKSVKTKSERNHRTSGGFKVRQIRHLAQASSEMSWHPNILKISITFFS